MLNFRSTVNITSGYTGSKQIIIFALTSIVEALIAKGRPLMGGGNFQPPQLPPIVVIIVAVAAGGGGGEREEPGQEVL